MRRYLACECGYVVASDDLDDLVTRAGRHARRVHGMRLSAEQLIWLSRPVLDDEGGTRRPDGAVRRPPRGEGP